MTYQPKTTAEQRRELVQYLCNVNHRGAKVQRICDDLAACEAALAEEQARVAALKAMVAKHKAADEALTARLKVDEEYTDKLEAMVRELVESAKTRHGKVTTYSIPVELCHKALALL